MVTSFYSQSEFDITNLLNKNASLLEAGRSCVRKEYRDGRIIKLLWKALATYIVISRWNIFLVAQASILQP